PRGRLYRARHQANNSAGHRVRDGSRNTSRRGGGQGTADAGDQVLPAGARKVSRGGEFRRDGCAGKGAATGSRGVHGPPADGARSLQAGGYHLEAAHEFERFMTVASLPVAGYRYDRELNYLIDEMWAAHLASAENDVAAGEYKLAIPHYQAAQREQPGVTFIA